MAQCCFGFTITKSILKYIHSEKVFCFFLITFVKLKGTCHETYLRWSGRSSTVHDPKTNVLQSCGLMSYGPRVLCPMVLCPMVILSMSYGPRVLCPMVLESYVLRSYALCSCVLWSYCLMSYCLMPYGLVSYGLLSYVLWP